MYVSKAIISMNYFCDAFIYIYVDNGVRKLMYRKLHVMKSICNVRWKSSQRQPDQSRQTKDAATVFHSYLPNL